MTRLIIIGERINPGFKSTKALFENEDFAGIQALAVKQAEAGASWLNINVGARANKDPAFQAEVIRAVQAVVSVPLSFDSASFEVQKVSLETYDPEKAGGRLPIINSLAETRLELAEALKVRPCKAVIMASERLEDGVGCPNHTADQVVGTALRMAHLLVDHYGRAQEDIFMDVSISALSADTKALTAMAYNAIATIRNHPQTARVHIMGGLSNLAQGLPDTAADGGKLRHRLEQAFLTLAMPAGFDTVLGTPWKDYSHLPEDDFVLRFLREFMDCPGGVDALRQLRKLYRK